MSLPEAHAIIKELLTVLPDAKNGEDWTWCWNELYGDSQDRVKEVRDKAKHFLMENEEV
jgi:hypothetical protein